MSNELWNLHCTHTTDEESDFDTVTEWAANYIVHLETQLAALKAGQGEPVAWTRVERDCCDEYFNAIVWAVDTNGERPNDDKLWVELYTAPTIPEGWVMVPVEPTDAMFIAGDKFMECTSSLGEAWEAMLAVAPKPEE